MEIYQKAFDIIERYFGTEEEDKDVSIDILDERTILNCEIFQIAPAADANTNQFAFAQPGGEGQQAGVPQQGFNF